VVLGAVALVVLHLGFRAWATYSSWFAGDDFAFISRMTNHGTSLETALEPHGGHVMPAGMYLTWLSDTIAPFDYRVTATMSLLLQLLCDVGLVVCLVRLFGWRPGILPAMAVAMFTVFSMPMAVWWAVGVNQLPLLAALFWGLASFVAYLRSRRPGPLAVSALWVVAGLCFYEKTLLVIGVFAIVALCYFTTGSLGARIVETWRSYRAAVVLYTLLGAGYVVAYYLFALNFDPGDAGNSAIDEVVPNMLLNTYLPGVLGGPLHWQVVSGAALPDPGNLEVIAWAAVVALVLREIHRTRTKWLRAWLIPAFLLVCDIALVVAGRATLVGPQIALELRYQGELGAATGLALAFATLPLIGAKEQVAEVPDAAAAVLTHPRRVAAATTAVVVAALVSSLTYVGHWQDNMQARAYFRHLFADLDAAEHPSAVVDEPVPEYVMWPLGYPDNLLSHLLRSHPAKPEFVDVATDHLSVVDDDGRLRPAQLDVVRHSLPGPRSGCGYVVEGEPVTIPFDGPVSYDGFWVRVGYLSSGRSPVVVTAGDRSYSTLVEPGVHALYLRAGDDFDTLRVSGVAEGIRLCTDDVIVGKPEAAPAAATQEAPS
jgi:hypothetical protein